MNIEICKKMLVAAFLTVCGALLLSGCELPSYNLANHDTPLQALEEFMDAVINQDNEKIGDMLYNYSWDSDYLSTPENVSETDAQIIESVVKSREYEIVSESDYIVSSHSAKITINYTTFDISKFEQTLSENVLEIIQQQQYEGVVFEDSSDTAEVIEAEKQELLQMPVDFFTTERYAVELISYKGQWKVVLSDEFYSALTGYAV